MTGFLSAKTFATSVEEIFELCKAQFFVCREGAYNAQPHTLMDHLVEVGRYILGRPPDTQGIRIFFFS